MPPTTWPSAAGGLMIVPESWAAMISVSYTHLDVYKRQDSDLYDLGGHSLLVLKLVDKVQAEFGTAITLEDVLQQTTPRLLCRRLRTVDPAVCNAPGGQNVAEPLDQTLVWLRRLDGHPTFYCCLLYTSRCV